MIVRPPAQRPAQLALGFLDRHVVQAGMAAPHQALFVIHASVSWPDNVLTAGG
jgi:hypothetical protein